MNDTCQYSFGSQPDTRLTVTQPEELCGKPATQSLTITLKGYTGIRPPSLCEEHYAFVRDALYPLAAQYSEQFAELKRTAPKRRPRAKVCPHCGKAL